MDMISVKDVVFQGVINPKAQEPVIENLRPFSHEFSFNKSFLLDSKLGDGGWALSWMIGGLIEPKFGSILKNNIVYKASERKMDSWCVRVSEIKKFGVLGNQKVSSQIQHGLKTSQNQHIKLETEIIKHFHLTSERYQRPIRQLSHESWRASCAIGLAHGKKIFCFPYIDQRLIEDFYDLWLKEMVDLLRDSGALVLIPAVATQFAEKLCDEIIPVQLQR